MNAILCRPKLYEFEGVRFEVSITGEPFPLKKDGEPMQRAGKKFYELYNRFDAMTPEEKESHRIGGGCMII